MSLKNNFKQAAKELMDGPTKPEPAAGQADQEQRTQKPATGARASRAEGASADAPAPATVIAAGTVVRGSVQCEGNLELYGEIQGDIKGRRDVKLQGKLKGGVVGVNVTVHGLRMEGDLHASGMVQVAEGTVVEGDVEADSLILNGKVQGNVHVKKRLQIQPKGVVCGSVAADRLMVEEGAVIQGEVHIGGDSAEKNSSRDYRAAATETEKL